MELVIADKKVQLTINDNSTFVSTCLQGTMSCTYQELVEKLGEPEDGDGDKVRAEWTINVTIDNTSIVATIYDWKEYSTSVEFVTDWHIGGVDENAVKLIQAIFPDKVCTTSRW